jgi:hypothetical protein
MEDLMAFKSVFDPDFKYRSADTTDVRLTFERIRRDFERIRREQRKAQRAALEAESKIVARIGPSAGTTRLNENQNT